MNCPACGHENDDWDVVCSNCGQALPGQPEAPAAPTPVAPVAPEVPYIPAPPAPPAPGTYGIPNQYPPPPPPSQYNQYAPSGPQSGYAPPMPEPYLWQSIVVTLLCCWPLGIPAIVNATRVGSLYQQGDYAGAQRASQEAKKWTFIALGAGVLAVVLYVMLVVVLGLGSFLSLDSVSYS